MEIKLDLGGSFVALLLAMMSMLIGDFLVVGLRAIDGEVRRGKVLGYVGIECQVKVEIQ